MVCMLSIEAMVDTELNRRLGPEPLASLRSSCGSFQALHELIVEDLYAYEKRDPASRGKATLILKQYPTFRAVMLHRIAHVAQASFGRHVETGREIAQHLSSIARLDTGIEIHPSARIGRRFVIDHGWGTIIGETTEIGDDCYVLGGVTLGAIGISNNPNGKRHPTIGNRVEVGGHARILGNITIGDDCFIAPYSIVTEDVAPRSRVVIVNQLQVVRGDEPRQRNLSVRGLVRAGRQLMLQASGLTAPQVTVVSEDHIPLLSLIVRPYEGESQTFVLEAPPAAIESLLAERSRLHLLLEDCDRRILLIDLHRLFEDAGAA